MLFVCEMGSDIVRPSDPHFNRIPKKIKDNDRYWPYFKDCIGAIDGTHIPVVMPASKQIPYIGRKGFPTQNVMAVCDFNMCFTFAWAGWEGSTYFFGGLAKRKFEFSSSTYRSVIFFLNIYINFIIRHFMT